MNYEEELRGWIRNSEARLISTKKMLEENFKLKNQYKDDEEALKFIEELKDSLRDSKNSEEKRLKHLQEEMHEIKNYVHFVNKSVLPYDVSKLKTVKEWKDIENAEKGKLGNK